MEIENPKGQVSDPKGYSSDLERLLSIVSQIDLASGTGDGFTVEELSDASGRCKEWVRSSISKLIKAGGIEFIGQKRCLRVDGVVCNKPAYRLIQK